MLVLSRKEGESFEFAELDVVVRVISLKKSKVQLGIEAPRDVRVHRSEIAAEYEARDSRVGEEENRRILDELVRVEAELAALAELADSKDRVVARQLAADSIARLEGIRCSLRMVTRQRSGPRPINDFVEVRAEVLQDLRKRHAGRESERPVSWPIAGPDQSDCVRQQRSEYVIGAPPAAEEYCVA